MRCLSVKQPWASLIASGHKWIELRTWNTNYRGELIIVSSLRADADSVERLGDGPRGCALCLVTLVDVRKAAPEDNRGARCFITEGDFAWVLNNPRLIPNIPTRGQLNLYAPTPSILHAIAQRRAG